MYSFPWIVCRPARTYHLFACLSCSDTTIDTLHTISPYSLLFTYDWQEMTAMTPPHRKSRDFRDFREFGGRRTGVLNLPG